MALFVIGLIFGLIGVLGLLAIIFVKSGFKLVTGGVGAVALLVAALFIVGAMYNSVPARTVGVPISFGKIGSPLQSGIHWEAPWVNITSCPLTEETDIQNGDPNSGTAAYNQAVAISGSDQGGATADVTVQYHIDPKDAQIVYQKFRCDLTLVRNNLIVQRVRSDVAAAAINFVSVDLKSSRVAIEQGALAKLQSDLTPFGITVDDVVIGDINLDPNVQTAANQKLAAQQQIGTATFQQQQATVQAQTAVITAQGQAQAAVTAAKGEAQANQLKQQSLTPAILCQQWEQAIQNGHVSVVNSAGPCGSSAVSVGSTSVIVPAG